ncbi:hypothetical protein RB653_006173 [Dictyostelium firmibasis]|uniref:IPT/TIG domain-containing protein n=1 Tax=Dictyostelium firmibasis TaxID=79012 RepID=A0AAN7UBK7_9MYCE
MNKLIYLYFIYLFFGCFYQVNGQIKNVPPNQEVQAIELLALTKGPSYNVVCTWLTCAPLNDGSGNYTITIIDLSLVNGIKSAFLDIDFSVFVNVTKIKLGQGIYASKLFDSLTNLTSLSILEIDTFNSTYTDSSLVMPKTMYQITINNLGTKLGVNFFNSPAYWVAIYNGLPGLELPSSFPPNFVLNEKLLTLQLPVRPGSGFPNNIGEAFKNLNVLFLYIQNGKFDSSYTDFNFPTFSQPFYNLTKLSINFINFDRNLNIPYPYQSWTFPNGLLNISRNLNEFYIINNGFNKSNTNSYLDFSFLKTDNFVLSLGGGDNRYYSPLESCDYIRCTTKPCLVLPPNSKLSLNWCYLNISTIDFRNVSHFTMNQNKLYQVFPVDSFNFNQENYYIDIRNNNFSGVVPQDFCYLKIGNFYFGNNDFTSAPTCFSCLGTGYFGNFDPNIVSVNPWAANFTNSGSNCNSFSLINQYNNVAKTDGSSIITIYGKDFGWYTKDPLYIRVGVPNKYLELYVPRGIGSGSQSTEFSNNKFEVFNYTYEQPVISSFYYNNSDNPQLLIRGTGFSFIGNNNVTIDGTLYTFSQAISYIHNGSIYPTVRLNNFPNGNKFTVSINVGGNISKNVTFFLNSTSGGGSTTSDSSTTGSTATGSTTTGSTTTGSTTTSNSSPSPSTSNDNSPDHPSSSSNLIVSISSFLCILILILY